MRTTLTTNFVEFVSLLRLFKIVQRMLQLRLNTNFVFQLKTKKQLQIFVINLTRRINNFSRKRERKMLNYFCVRRIMRRQVKRNDFANLLQVIKFGKRVFRL